VEVAKQLEAELEIPNTVRMHWTGCPNSCGQAQVGDIGLMGGPAKLEGKAVEGVRIFKGGKIGEGAELAAEFEKGVAAQADVLIPRLKELLIEEYGCTPKP
jgi:ferredoxin-nitrite reductase